MGRVPYGTLEGDADAYDRGVSAIMDTITTLTRVPGLGAQSDYEARLKAATLPERTATAQGRAQSLNDLRMLVRDMRAEYATWLKQFGGPGGRNAPASSTGARRVNSIDEARALPKGTRFIDPNGVERVR